MPSGSDYGHCGKLWVYVSTVMIGCWKMQLLASLLLTTSQQQRQTVPDSRSFRKNGGRPPLPALMLKCAVGTNVTKVQSPRPVCLDSPVAGYLASQQRTSDGQNSSNFFQIMFDTVDPVRGSESD